MWANDGAAMSQERAVKIVDRIAYLFAAVFVGLYVGWLIWGGR